MGAAIVERREMANGKSRQMNLSDIENGQRVAYVPTHAKGNLSHKDVEWGKVSSKNDKYVFVRFDKQVSKFGWEGATSQSCRPEDLSDGKPKQVKRHFRL